MSAIPETDEVSYSQDFDKPYSEVGGLLASIRSEEERRAARRYSAEGSLPTLNIQFTSTRLPTDSMSGIVISPARRVGGSGIRVEEGVITEEGAKEIPLEDDTGMAVFSRKTTQSSDGSGSEGSGSDAEAAGKPMRNLAKRIRRHIRGMQP